MSNKASFEKIRQKMEAENLPQLVIDNFYNYYKKLVEGDSGKIPEIRIRPVESLPDSEVLEDRYNSVGSEALQKTAMLKLNGGLGTSMGLDRAKSLLSVKDGKTFLDIVAEQARLANVPLILMNSFATREDSLALLKKHPELSGNIPMDFLQHKVPKLRRDNLEPVSWPQNPALEWCPPGHGDLYLAIVTSGLLEKLLEYGIEFLFVSNVDNLGASIDENILGYFAVNNLPFMMEVTDRTETDKKGGHLARGLDGGFVLREIAQCPEDDLDFFQNIERHRFFNTNNLWINLKALKKMLEENNYLLDLPLIRNAKTVDPKDSSSTPVYQLETAMGSAIQIFEGAGAIRVPRTRFAPVKNTNDLLRIRSDCYLLDEKSRIVPNPVRTLPPVNISLDEKFYKLIDDFEKRFPFGAPSLLYCQELVVEGDVVLGKDIILSDRVRIKNSTGSAKMLEDGSRLSGVVILN